MGNEYVHVLPRLDIEPRRAEKGAGAGAGAAGKRTPQDAAKPVLLVLVWSGKGGNLANVG